MVDTSPITFVCCVEAGGLETQTVRMVQSLRQYGGRLATAPIVAVTSRSGPALSRKTHQVFEQYQIEYLKLDTKKRKDSYSWNHFLNKPHAILEVDERSKTEAIAWLDSDILIVNEPNQLVLQPQESFLACTSDRFGATTGPDDPLEPYWKAICQQLNLDIEALPWVTTEWEKARVRYYFNSGVFVYRRETSFAKQYLENCIRILDAKVSSKVCGFFFTDQIALGLTAAQLNLPWRSLPRSYNYGMSPLKEGDHYNEEEVRNACILHYHGSMWPSNWVPFSEVIEKAHPQVSTWLNALGPMKNEASFLSRSQGKVFKYFRDKKSNTYSKSCSVI